MTATTVSPLRGGRQRPVRPSARPDLHVVREPRRRHTLSYVLAIVVLVGAAVFGAVSMNALSVAAAVDAHALEANVVAAERDYAQLVAEVAALEDPGRIRSAALELGLVPSGPARVLALERHVESDGAVADSLRGEATSDPLKPVLSAER